MAFMTYTVALHVANSLKVRQNERTFMAKNGEFGTKRTTDSSKGPSGVCRTHAR